MYCAIYTRNIDKPKFDVDIYFNSMSEMFDKFKNSGNSGNF